MPEDNPYIKKLFGFMESAFGPKGKLAPGAFTNDFDTFVNKITTNPKYADKIHSALNDAYGQKGKVKKGAFTSNPDSFKAKVLAPDTKQGQFQVAQQLMDYSNIGNVQPQSPDPNSALIQSSIDIQTPLYKSSDGTFKPEKEPGLMSDIRAFEPLIADKEAKDQKVLDAFSQQVFNTDPEVDVMTGKELPLTDFKVQIKDFVNRAEVFDKELQAQQAKADEFAKTTAGGLYYSFVKPVYQTFLNVGKNVGAGSVRLAGGIGGGLGLNESERILNKTADGIVDYFDFNRLAREGNPTGFLNMTPTSQQGKLSRKNILPKAVEAISSMATLMGGARVLGGNTPALFTSSFMSTFEDYRKAAKQNGLSNNEADQFAIASAGLTSVLEMISPNKLLLKPGEFTSAARGVFQAIKDGVPVKSAIKSAFKETVKEIGKENVQEFSQAVGDKIVRGGTDLITGQNRFNEDGALPSFDEALETAVLTTIATGVISGRRFARNANPSNIERSAWAQAAERPEIIEQGISNGLENGTITEEQAAKIQQDVSNYKQIYDALSDQLAETNPNADISRIAFDAFQSQRIKEQQQPIQGIPALAPIQQQNEQANAELESNIKDEMSGIPEVGTEVSAAEVKDIMSQTGGENKIDQVGGNDYKTTTINLADLYNTNPQFKEYVDQNKLRQNSDEDGLRAPVIVRNDGQIVDGFNRLAQQYVNGNTSARAFVETNNVEEVAPETVAQSGITVQRPQDITRIDPVTIGVQDQVQPNETIAAPIENVSQASREDTPRNAIQESKIRRDKAISNLKDAWSAYGRMGIANDPSQNLERDKKFYSALATYVREELLYRVNQVKGYAGRKKAQMKRDIARAVKAKGIQIEDQALLNDAFEEAYESARNIPGFLADQNDRVSYTKYIKDRIQSREAGRKTGFGEGRERGKKEGEKSGISEAARRVKAVRTEILNAVKKTGIKLTIPQLRQISVLLQSAAKSQNIDESIENALDVTSQIVWEAKNSGKIQQANRLIKDLKRLKKNESMVVGDVEWLKMQQLPAPNQVSDLDEYIQYLEDFSKSRRANKARADVTKKRFQQFLDQETAAIYSRKKKRWESELQRLKDEGIIDQAVTLDEYIKMLEHPNVTEEEDSDGPKMSKKQKQLIDVLGPRLLALKLGQGEFRGTIPGMEGDAQKVANELTDIKVDELNIRELIFLNNILNNIIETGSVDGAGDLITSYQAKSGIDKLESEGIKIREMPSQKVINKKNISNIFSSLFYNDKAIASFRQKVLGGIENKVSKVKDRAQNVVKEFVEIAKANKIGAMENARLHAVAYLNQYKGVDQSETSESIKQRLEELIDDATYLYNEGKRVKGKKGQPIRNDANQRLAALNSLGLIEYGVTDGNLSVEINEDFLKDNNLEAQLNKSINELSPGERTLYDFVLNKYAELTDKLEFVTRTYANKEFKRERNYVSQVARRKDGKPEHNPELSDQTDLTYNQRSVNSRPSGTTITRADKKGDNVYYDGDFFSNFANRYYQSLYTSEVLPDLQKSAKMVNNEKFRQFITGQLDKGFEGQGAENYLKFKNKFIQVVNDEKYAPFFKRGKTNIADALISRGVRLVLGNVWQAPKQYAPAVIHNFAINNHKAVTYAMRSKGRAILDPEYRAQRQAFLKQFTGVQRSALGSEAYDKNVKSITEDPSWWMKPLGFLDKTQKISSYALERADKAAQNDAYIASYITSLIDQKIIKSPSEFDIVKETESPNKEALAYAEQMASNINNESAKAYRADVLSQGDYAKYLWLLQGFSLNAYQNAMNKAKIIGDNRATQEEKIEAVRHFLGYLGEMGTYQLVGKWARNSQLAIAGAILSSIWGVKDEKTEEEKKNKRIKDNIRTGAGIIGDLTLSGLPAPAQAAMKIAANYGYQQWAKIEREEKKKEAKKVGKKFNPKGTYLSPMYVPYYGADGPGGAADFYTAIGKKGIDQIVKAYESEGKDGEDTSNEKLATNLNLYLGIPSAALGLGDLVLLNTRMQQVIKDAGKNPKKTGPVSGSRRRSRSRSRNRLRPGR